MAESKNFTVHLWGWDKWSGTSIFIIKWIILNDAIVSKSSDFLEIKTLKKRKKGNGPSYDILYVTTACDLCVKLYVI